MATVAASRLASGEFSPDLLDSICNVDEAAGYLRSECDWLLAAFISVFDEDLTHVLLVQLGDYAKARYAGHPWTLPGGSVLSDESPSTALLREVGEETQAFVDTGSLRLAGWFPRPYHRPHHRDRPGELLLLYAAVGHLDDSNLRPAPPETLACQYYPFSLESFLAVPSRGAGAHPLQPLPKHWAYWAEAGRTALANQLAPPLVHVYRSADEMQLPPWATEPSVQRIDAVSRDPDGE